VQGRLNKTVYSRDPLKTARHWVKQGATLLHVVDLDGAFTGVPANIGVISSIIREIGIQVECGGGIRTKKIAAQLVKAGAYRIILGTKAANDEKFLDGMVKEFGGRVAVSVDACHDEVMTSGWKDAAGGMGLVPFIAHLKAKGLRDIIYTDTSKDGTLKGPSLRNVKRILGETGVRLIVSGGIASLDDIRKLKEYEKDGVRGVIVGKALYEGKFTLPEAIKMGA
jgi:phosphoribosylformimino-5-aminoimidazole carboxamide ribotide isomerase